MSDETQGPQTIKDLVHQRARRPRAAGNKTQGPQTVEELRVWTEARITIEAGMLASNSYYLRDIMDFHIATIAADNILDEWRNHHACITERASPGKETTARHQARGEWRPGPPPLTDEATWWRVRWPSGSMEIVVSASNRILTIGSDNRCNPCKITDHWSEPIVLDPAKEAP